MAMTSLFLNVSCPDPGSAISSRSLGSFLGEWKLEDTVIATALITVSKSFLKSNLALKKSF
jgi:hypothetical protein